MTELISLISLVISLVAALITILASPLLPKLLSQRMKNRALENAIIGEGFLMAQYWLWVGADPNMVDKDGWTPLQWASYVGNLDFVQTIVDKYDADIESPNSSAKSALILSIRNCERWNSEKFEIMKFLLERGANCGHAMLYAKGRSNDEYKEKIIEILKQSCS